ncbi:LON peptidase substrate-binding domain-containing protein [Thalassolituus sp. LLYu03]|uniref:LON peptidase substrate-binding domain-containing protein n=1 Tax=Thalassolituus sp. LLYu03 TaxID=3421656 RepID=UPI003D2E57F1
MEKICVFPIPDCVTFPGNVFPLHVFEPRYRAMIQHCLESGMKVAIAHTRKTIHEARPNDNLVEALNSNQSTYQPYDVVGAGTCELLNTTDDGRLYLNVHIRDRYRLHAEVQRLPYLIYDADVFADEPDDDALISDNEVLKDKIIHRLAALARGRDVVHKDIADLLESPPWQSMSAADFSFRIFGLVRFDGDLLQELLETTSVHERLRFTLELLNEV